MPPKHVQKKVSADAEEIAHHDDNQLILQFMSLLKDDVILKKLRDALYPQELSNKIDLTNAKLTQMSAQLAERDVHIAELEKKVSTLELELDELQQYSRRPNLRLQGVEDDTRGEDLERKLLAVINGEMKLDPPVERKDIERCHRLGRVDGQQKQNQPRTAIVRFTSERVRDSVYRSRGSLKEYNSKRGIGSRVFINEDLTRSRSKLAYETRRLKKENKINDCWTASGRILIKDRSDKIVRICSDMDIKKFD